MRFYRFTLFLLLILLLTVEFGFSQGAVAQIEIPVEVKEADVDKYHWSTRSIPIIIETELTVNQIYDKAIRSVVWIIGDDVQASGVLIDKELKLVVTNEHVVGTDENLVVLFPATDKDGNLIEERDFYLNALRNDIAREVLIRLGYATVGRVVAKNPETDLAILELEGIAETALEIDHNFRHVGFQINMKDNVHILGNPGKLKLWRWTLGMFQGVFKEDGKEMLHMNADTYPGNSGGPVLNGRGKLIGIISRSNLGTSTVVVPLKYVDELLKELKPRHTVYIFNDTIFTIPFRFRASENNNWKETSLKPEESATITLSVLPHETIPKGYPKIRFDHVTGDGKVTPFEKTLKTFQRLAGSNFKAIPKHDAYGYYFYHDPSENKLYLTDKLRESSQVE